MVFCLFSLLLLMIWLDRNRKIIVLSRNSNKQYKYSATNYIIFFTCALLAISALRAENIGIDTPSYLWVFMRGDYLGASLGSFSTETEVGFMLVQKICSITGIGFRGLIVICSIMAIIPVGIYILKNSENPFVSFYLYVCLDYYFFSMTGMRQSFAIGLCLIALSFIKKNKIIPFVIVVLIASSIHKTAIIFLPVYLLSKVKISRKHALLVVGAGSVFFVFKPYIRNILRSFARIDYSSMDTGGTGYYLLMVAILLVYFFLIDVEEENYSMNLSANMVIVATLLFPILQYNPTVLRLHYYYSIALIILIPNTLLRIRDGKIKFVISSVFFTVVLYYFVFYTMKNMGVLPYSFCF